MKKWFFWDIEDLTLSNENFRKVLYSGEHLQLVAMKLKPNEEIWFEAHNDNDQFFRFESGSWVVHINDSIYEVWHNDVVIVPAWAKHNVMAWNDGLKMYTIYWPSHHKDGVIHETKDIADIAEESSNDDFDWTTTE